MNRPLETHLKTWLDTLVTELLSSLLFHDLLAFTVIVGSNPDNRNMWEELIACAHMTLAANI